MTNSREKFKTRLRKLANDLISDPEIDQREDRIIRISSTGTTKPGEPDYDINEMKAFRLWFEPSTINNKDGVKELSKWLYESENGYRPSQEDGINGMEASYLPYPEKDDGSKKDVIVDSYIEDISSFINKVIAFSGMPREPITNVTIPEDAFDAAFEEFFGWRYDEEITYEVVIPLLNFEGSFNKIDLGTDVVFFQLKSHRPERIANHLLSTTETLDSLEISEMTDAELSGIFGNKPRRDWGPFPSHKIKFQLTTPGTNPRAVEDIAYSILTALRLFAPTGNLGLDNGHKIQRDWKYYRTNKIYDTGTYDFTTSIAIRSLPEPLTYTGYSREMKSGGIRGLNVKIMLSEEESKQFKRFWDSYSKIISSAQNGGRFLTPINRFNMIYERNRYEDQIIDGIITAESTLGKDVNGNERVLFAVRAAYLLQDSFNPSYVYNIMKNIYDIRIGIVHRGEEVEATNITYSEENEQYEQKFEEKELIEEFCVVLSNVLVEYFERFNNGCNIHNTNTNEINENIGQFISQNPSIESKIPDNRMPTKDSTGESEY